ncbi:MAG: type I pantothenate kinase [Actinomycetota bacterium]
MQQQPAVSPFVDLTRDQWAELRASTPLTLSEDDLFELHGLNESVSLREVEEVYLPLSRLLNLQVHATQELHASTETFLGHGESKVPYVIGVAGSVAVGKSTTARILRELLARWPDHPRVDLVTTDGFLLPNAVLSERGLMERKGFPESYDRKRLLRFLADVKSGRERLEVPEYSHLEYDVVADEVQVIERPDILILEGLTVLQTGAVRDGRTPRIFVSDFFDFSIYVDARDDDVRRWYIDRFLKLREAVFRDPKSFFHRYADLTDDQARDTAAQIWDTINGVNLRENIEPTRERAKLILKKGPDHEVRRVLLRKL